MRLYKVIYVNKKTHKTDNAYVEASDKDQAYLAFKIRFPQALFRSLTESEKPVSRNKGDYIWNSK